MKKAGLLDSPRRGYFRVTERGLEVLRSRPGKIDVTFLQQFPEFQEFRSLHHETSPPAGGEEQAEEETPEESLESAHERLRGDLEGELLETVKKCSPSFFEQLVVDLVVKMGYGGTRQDAGRAVGQSGDGGIDGIIKQDRLGLDVIYIQAKRWGAVVGRPEVQKFAGALQGHRAKKGILITTSSFSKDAQEYASRIDSNLVLIDGQMLVQLMIDHNLGVSPAALYEVKKLDHDYFTEE